MNKIIEGIKDSKSIELMLKANALKDAGIDIISLAGGEPDFATPNLIKQKAIEEINNNNTHYAVGKGIIALRKAISKKLMEENGVSVSEDEIIVTPGAKMAIYLAVHACISHGDEVLILTPSWVSYSEIVKSAGGTPVEVKLDSNDKYRLKQELLENKTTSKTKMIIVCSPNNPTGRVLSEEEISELIRFAKDKDIIVLSDEIYEKIVYDGKKNISLASKHELYSKTLTVNGFSKAFAMTGWRLGYIAGPANIINSIYKLFIHTVTGTPPFIQEAASLAFECEKEISEMVAEFERRKKYFVSQLKDIKEINVFEPEGTFYVWVKFNTIERPAEYLLNKAGVICIPGEAYGTGFEKFVRFSISSDMKNIEEAVKRIRTAFGY